MSPHACSEGTGIKSDIGRCCIPNKTPIADRPIHLHLSSRGRSPGGKFCRCHSRSWVGLSRSHGACAEFFFSKTKMSRLAPPAGWGDSSSRSNGSVKTHRGGGKKSPWRAPRDPHPPVVPGRPGSWGSTTAAKAITSPLSRTSQKPDPRLLSDAATGDPTSYAYVAGPEEGNGRAARKGGGGSATSTGRRHPRPRSLLLRAEGHIRASPSPSGGAATGR